MRVRCRPSVERHVVLALRRWPLQAQFRRQQLQRLRQRPDHAGSWRKCVFSVSLRSGLVLVQQMHRSGSLQSLITDSPLCSVSAWYVQERIQLGNQLRELRNRQNNADKRHFDCGCLRLSAWRRLGRERLLALQRRDMEIELREHGLHTMQQRPVDAVYRGKLFNAVPVRARQFMEQQRWLHLVRDRPL